MFDLVMIMQDTPAEPEPAAEGWGLELLLGAGLLGLVLGLVIWRRLNRPLPMERLPEVARRQRMKGL